MANFTVNGVYNYKSANIYSYLGRLPSNSTSLENVFEKYDITPTGKVSDLEKLDSAMYADYSKQVQNQIDNQNKQEAIPWAGLLAQIGIQATGNYEQDYVAFNNAIQLLSQSAIDGQAMAYFAGLKSEASKFFGSNTTQNQQLPQITYEMYKYQYIR